jgi:hypothetical protein
LSPWADAFLEKQPWTCQASSDIDAAQIEVRMARLVVFYHNRNGSNTRNSRAGSCPG